MRANQLRRTELLRVLMAEAVVRWQRWLEAWRRACVGSLQQQTEGTHEPDWPRNLRPLRPSPGAIMTMRFRYRPAWWMAVEVVSNEPSGSTARAFAEAHLVVIDDRQLAACFKHLGNLKQHRGMVGMSEGPTPSDRRCAGSNVRPVVHSGEPQAVRLLD